MSLREKLGHPDAVAIQSARRDLFSKYGITRNPFPPAGEPSGHPHLETPAEEMIVGAVRNFSRDRVSQVLLIQGTQGVGKTNLLNYYQEQLELVFNENSDGFYIIRYYPDPEASFEGIIRRLFQEFHQSGLLKRLGQSLAQNPKKDSVIERALSHEMRLTMRRLSDVVQGGSEDELASTVELVFEWLTGMRILNRHRDGLGVHFRLDTVESKTQALRDLVFCSSSLGLLNGIFLLLDELEKQDYSASKTVVLRYLSAIRALIDALPRHLFMLVALTIEARRRYFSMLPALAGRLQNIVEVSPLKSFTDAQTLFEFYLARAREQALTEANELMIAPGSTPLYETEEISDLFSNLLQRATTRGQEGVTQRNFLNALHLSTEQKFQTG